MLPVKQENDLINRVSVLLSNLMAVKGMSTTDLAKKSGISNRTYVENIVKGEQNVTIKVLARLLYTLGVEVSDVIIRPLAEDKEGEKQKGIA